jgi:hypothetical protein
VFRISLPSGVDGAWHDLDDRRSDSIFVYIIASAVLPLCGVISTSNMWIIRESTYSKVDINTCHWPHRSPVVATRDDEVQLNPWANTSHAGDLIKGIKSRPYIGNSTGLLICEHHKKGVITKHCYKYYRVIVVKLHYKIYFSIPLRIRFHRRLTLYQIASCEWLIHSEESVCSTFWKL